MIRVTNSYPGLYIAIDVHTTSPIVYLIFPKNAAIYIPYYIDVIPRTGTWWSISQFNPDTTLFIQAKSYEDIVFTLTKD